ncbi:MAG: hypothetical protein BVN31_08910 [Proteobacteria bacterium ST_bin15]|nr:MAG: hypothetical protein BVN31_08910 [Proteobacteria bacterium ST_bin15]
MTKRGARIRLGIGSAVLAIMLILALVSLVWTPGDPYRLAIAQRLQGPSWMHLLGTDQLGRDIAAILMIGARNALLVSVGAVGLSLLVGGALGLIAAMQPDGIGDQMIARTSDLVFAFPVVLLAIMTGLILGPGAASAAMAIAIFTMPVFIRLTRDSAAQLREREFVLAARAMGASWLRIAVRHILPLLLPRLAVQASTQLALALLAEAGLSYLGLGTPPPHPSWGRMLNEAQTYLGTQPLLAILPGVAIALTVMGFNLLGEGLAARLARER